MGMFKSTLQAILLAGLCAAGAGSAQAGTITFDDVRPDFYYQGGPSSFTTGGYLFSVTSDYVFIIPGQQSDPTVISNGTTLLDLLGTVHMTNVANAPFSVEGFDYGTYASSASSNVRLTGTRADGSVVSRDYTSPAIDYVGHQDSFTTENLTGFNNLVSFDMEVLFTPDFTYAIAFDNIAVEAANDVPEPASWAILGLGLALIATAGRRKHSV